MDRTCGKYRKKTEIVKEINRIGMKLRLLTDVIRKIGQRLEGIERYSQWHQESDRRQIVLVKRQYHNRKADPDAVKQLPLLCLFCNQRTKINNTRQDQYIDPVLYPCPKKIEKDSVACRDEIRPRTL